MIIAVNYLILLKQYIGYEYGEQGSIHEKKNVVIVDLSGMPFEIFNNCVSLIISLILNFASQKKI